MRARPHRPLPAPKHLRADLGIMQQPQRIIPAIAEPIEPPLLQPQPHGNRPHHQHMHLLAAVMELQHPRLEAPALVVRVVGPAIRTPRRPLPPNLKALLQIRALALALRRHVLGVQRRARLLPPRLAVAAVRLGRRPGEGELLRGRAAEEGGGFGEGLREQVRGDGVVVEVDEAGVLEAGEDGVGGGFFGGGGGGEEGGEVDERDGEVVGCDGGPGGVVGHGGGLGRDFGLVVGELCMYIW